MNNGLTISGGNLGFDLGTTTNDLLNVNGAGIDFAGASTLTPSGGTPGSSYNVMSEAMSGSAVPTLVEPVGTTRFSYTYGSNSYNSSNGGTTLVITVNGQVGNLTWNNSADVQILEVQIDHVGRDKEVGDLKTISVDVLPICPGIGPVGIERGQQTRDAQPALVGVWIDD